MRILHVEKICTTFNKVLVTKYKLRAGFQYEKLGRSGLSKIFLIKTLVSGKREFLFFFFLFSFLHILGRTSLEYLIKITAFLPVQGREQRK